MSTLVVPDPSLVALVGPAGSGKSTLAARHFAPDEILSSDELREAIAGDARDQRATRAAFGALHRQLARRLAAGQLTVVDATSVERHARTALLGRARDAGVPAVAIVLDLPPSIVLARNAARAERPVDPGVVRHHLATLRSAVDLGLLAHEEWTLLLRIRDAAELDELRIERRRQPGLSRRRPPTPGPTRPRSGRSRRRPG